MDPTLLSPIYANDAVFDGSMRRSAAQLRLLMDRGLDRGNLPDMAKLLYIAGKRRTRRGRYGNSSGQD